MRRAAYILIPLLLIAAMSNAKKSVPALTDTLIYQRDSLFVESIRLKNLSYGDSAIVALQRADSIDNRNAAICYELGNQLLKRDFDRAYKYLEKASELSPDNYYYQKKLITANLYTGNLNAAISGYEKLLKRYPDHEGDIYDLAGLYVRAGEYKKAIQTYERLERLIGTDRYVSLSKVSVYLEQKDKKSAIKTIDRLIEEMPLDASLHAYKGDIYMDMKEIELAKECYLKSLALDSLNGYAIESLYIYYIRTGEEDKAAEYLKKIFTSTDIQFSTKKQYLNQIVKYTAATKRPFYEIEPYYKAMLEAESENAEARLLYADYLINMKRPDEAIEELRSAIYVNPQCKECWEYLLYQVAESADSVMVEKTLADAMDAIPESADFYYYSGVWNYGGGNKEEALSYLLKADSIVTASGNKELTDDNRKTLWNYLFTYYYESGDKERYYHYLEKSINAFPDDVMTLNNYAYILAVNNDDIEKAEKLSKKTIEKEPLNYTYLDTYAYILMRQGKLTYAKFYIEQAMEYMKPAPDAVVYEHYGDILFKTGNPDKAMEMWQKAYGMEREGLDKDKLKQKIETKQYVE
ncbi:MAG: tetratricopeptide repeat protein [Paludibacteraceae bacterium]|nr:tetratricopeptide repeat protein [Paludibacteraceae bacterium]